MKQDEVGSGRIGALTTTEREELRFLRRENRVLKEERERYFLRLGDEQEPVRVFEFIQRDEANHSVTTMCRVPGVSSGGYYKWRKQRVCVRKQSDIELTRVICSIHLESCGTHGAPRIRT
jgi:hypothetical protein